MQSKVITEIYSSSINTVFTKKWPSLADKRVNAFKNSGKKEVKDLLDANSQFIGKGIFFYLHI